MNIRKIKKYYNIAITEKENYLNIIKEALSKEECNQELQKYFKDQLNYLISFLKLNESEDHNHLIDKLKYKKLISLHNHSDFSDGSKLEQILNNIKYVDVFALTDHNTAKGFDYLLSNKNLRKKIDKINNFSLIYKNNNKDIVVLKGMELFIPYDSSIKTSFELNLIGIYDEEEFKKIKFKAEDHQKLNYIIKEAKNQDAMILLNHPFIIRIGIANKNPLILRKLKYFTDAIEWNAQMGLGFIHNNALAKYFSEKYDIPLIATNDAHQPNQYENSGFLVDKVDIENIIPDLRSKIKSREYINVFKYHTFISYLKTLF